MARGAGDTPLVETAFQRLRQEIQDGRLLPGTRIVEQEIARRLNMSRTPVREAIRRLEETGLVMQAPQRGLAVTSLDQQAVTELYNMREVLEGTAAELAAQHASPAEISAMQRMVEGQPALADAPVIVAEHNRVLHELIYHASHNRFLLRTLNGLRDSLALLGPTTFQAAGRREVAHNEHERIVAAIAARDAELAGREARAHIRSAHAVRIGMMAEAGLIGPRPA